MRVPVVNRWKNAEIVARMDLVCVSTLCEAFSRQLEFEGHFHARRRSRRFVIEVSFRKWSRFHTTTAHNSQLHQNIPQTQSQPIPHTLKQPLSPRPFRNTNHSTSPPGFAAVCHSLSVWWRRRVFDYMESPLVAFFGQVIELASHITPDGVEHAF